MCEGAGLQHFFEGAALVCVTACVTNLPACCREGQMFERGKHTSGTEVKAITYSNMQIREQTGDAEIFVIVDI